MPTPTATAVFAIGESSGAITVAGTLAQADAPYELTVTARDAAGGTATVAVTVRLTDLDYDLDDDGLLEVANLAQLNAIRWDLDGDGSSTEAGYATAFADAVTGMGCPTTGCTGYELTQAIWTSTPTAAAQWMPRTTIGTAAMAGRRSAPARPRSPRPSTATGTPSPTSSSTARPPTAWGCSG